MRDSKSYLVSDEERHRPRARRASRAGVIRLFYALLSLPSPPTPIVFEAGPLTLRYYGLCIVLGIIVGTWLTGRQLASRGYDGTLALESLFFVIPLGLAGARLYHVATQLLFSTQYAKPFPRSWRSGRGAWVSTAGSLAALLACSSFAGIVP